MFKEKQLLRLNSVEKYERRRISVKKFKGWRQLIIFYVGEHNACTEFVIGSFSVAHGVAVGD